MGPKPCIASMHASETITVTSKCFVVTAKTRSCRTQTCLRRRLCYICLDVRTVVIDSPAASKQSRRSYSFS